MKKLVFILSMCVFLLAGSGTLQAMENPTANTPTKDAKANQMEQRLEEIRAMDLSKLSRPEKKALRKEVKRIKKENALSGGVYISVGGLIIIILLLILLL